MSNTRIITAIVAFVASFIFSAGLVRIIFPAPTVQYVYREPARSNFLASEIESFISNDEYNGSIRMRSRRSAENFPEAVMDYWKTSSSMDASRFPQDFQNAWREHMQAWRNYADYLKIKKDAVNDDSCPLDGRYNSEINRTWEEVLRIGRSHGADVQ